jgi:hypothetical protein
VNSKNKDKNRLNVELKDKNRALDDKEADIAEKGVLLLGTVAALKYK